MRSSPRDFIGSKLQVIKRVKALKNIGLKDYISSDKIHVFHHIPKCSGTSIRKALENWFFIVRDYTPPNNIDLSALKNSHCLVGHYPKNGIPLLTLYPELLHDKTKYRIFAFIRNPLETKISEYYYGNRFTKRTMSLEDFLVSPSLSNRLARGFNCNSSNYKQILDGYFFIGTSEKIQKSLDILATLIDKPKINAPHYNVTKKKRDAKTLPPELIKKFNETNSLDFLIYEYCTRKFKI